MGRRIAAVLVALATFGALAWAGDEGKTYEINWRSRWKVGQVVTVTEHQTGDTEVSRDGTVLKNELETFDATYVVRCDELDAKGNSSKKTVFVKSWKKTKGGQTDESISGLRVTVADKVWKLPEGKSAGPLATKWLDKEFGKRDHGDPLTKLAPPSMAVGQTWKPDPKAAMEAFSESMDDAPFDPNGIEFEVKFVSVEGTPPDASGRFALKFHLPIASKVPGLPPGAVVAPGSAGDAVGERSGPLTTSTMLGTEHLEMTMTMNIQMTQQGQVVSISNKAKTVQDKKTVPGGEIPEPPAPPAPPATGPEAPAPK